MADQPKAKILLIDDDPTLLTTYEMAFSSKGYATIVAHDGAEGLAKATKEKPDLIVVDLMMPRLDGKQFIEQVRADDTLKDTPIIACTALIEDLEKAPILKLGATAYVVKTETDPNKLVKKAESYLK